MKKRVVSILLALVLVLASGCQSSTDSNTEPPAETENPAEGKGSSSLTDGTYTAVANGRNGKVTVEVTIASDKIAAVEVVKHSETAIISEPAFERVPKNIVENQSLQMDAISGATFTRNAIIAATADAIEQAGGDASEWKNREGQHTEAGETIEKTADVIVVGGGGAGLAAAVSAIDQGASVILIEKTSSLGGNTLLSGGVLNAADPEWQAEAPADKGEAEELENWMNMDVGSFPEEYQETFKTLQSQIKQYLAGSKDYLFDSTELHIIQTYYYGARTGLDGTKIYGTFELVKNLAENGLPTVNWLAEKGIEWQKNVSEPVGAMWRRGHTPTMPKGQEYTIKLGQSILNSGNEYILETKAKSLIVEDGKVVGVEAEQSNGTKVVLHANKGVILTTGGYGSNTAMVQEYNNYWKNIPDNSKTTNASGSTGDGIIMATAIGADLTGMGFAQMMPVSDTKTGDLFTGLIPRFASSYIFVNKEGRRFVDEGSERDALSKAAFNQTDGVFYMIADADIAEEAKWLTDPEVEVENGRAYKADTLEELAELIKVDPATLVEEMEKYNSYVDSGVDPEFGKASFLQKVDVPPYYATPRSPAIHHTMGGLVIDVDTHVLAKDGSIISGLYAAGEVTGGIHAGNRLGGNAIADIFVNGRIAGANAAKGN